VLFREDDNLFINELFLHSSLNFGVRFRRFHGQSRGMQVKMHLSRDSGGLTDARQQHLGQPLTTQLNSLFKHRISVPAASENELCKGQEEVL